MPRVCAVKSCPNSSTLNQDPNISFHRIPADPGLRTVWLRCCGLRDNLKGCRFDVCSHHFSESDYKRDLCHELMGRPTRKILNPGALPMVMPLNKACKSRRGRLIKRKIKKCVKGNLKDNELIPTRLLVDVIPQPLTVNVMSQPLAMGEVSHSSVAEVGFPTAVIKSEPEEMTSSSSTAAELPSIPNESSCSKILALERLEQLECLLADNDKKYKKQICELNTLLVNKEAKHKKQTEELKSKIAQLEANYQEQIVCVSNMLVETDCKYKAELAEKECLLLKSDTLQTSNIILGNKHRREQVRNDKILKSNTTLRREITAYKRKAQRREMDFNNLNSMLNQVLSPAQQERLLTGKQVKWTEEDINHGVALSSLSMKSYVYVKNKMGIPLPSLTTLRRICSKDQTKDPSPSSHDSEKVLTDNVETSCVLLTDDGTSVESFADGVNLVGMNCDEDFPETFVHSPYVPNDNSCKLRAEKVFCNTYLHNSDESDVNVSVVTAAKSVFHQIPVDAAVNDSSSCGLPDVVLQDHAYIAFDPLHEQPQD